MHKTLIFTSFFFVLMFSASAQQYTVAEKKAAWDYIENLKTLVTTLRQYIGQSNQATFDRQHSTSQQLLQQKQYLEAGQLAIETFGALKVPVQGEALRGAALAYCDQFEVLLRANANETYVQKANTELNCQRCLDALYRAHQLQTADWEKSDRLLADLSKELDAFAAAYSIALEAGGVAKNADQIRLANSYAVVLGLAVGHASHAHKEVRTILQKVLSGKSAPAELPAHVPFYAEAITEARIFFEKNVAKDFEGNKTFWESANALITQFEAIQQNTLPTLVALLNKTQLSDPEKTQAQELIQAFNAPALALQQLQEAMLAFLQKKMN